MLGIQHPGGTQLCSTPSSRKAPGYLNTDTGTLTEKPQTAVTLLRDGGGATGVAGPGSAGAAALRTPKQPVRLGEREERR